MTKTNKKRTGILAAAGLILGLALIAGIMTCIRYKNYQTKVNELAFSDIGLDTLADGTYVGEYDADVIYARVEVTIQNGRISDLNILEHRNERGEGAEAIITAIITEQRLDVDTVSSATNSSKVIRKAVENALSGSPGQ